MKPIICLTILLYSQLLFGQNFTEKPLGTPFEGMYWSSMAFSDVNGDGAPDVLITGESCPSIAILYINDGSGNFSEVPDTPLMGVVDGSIAFSDVNGDGTSDVLLTGWNSIVGDGIAKLYLNDGTGQFSEMQDTPFDGVRNSSIAFSDVNGDGTPDVLITGDNNSGNGIAKLYVNDGDGNFSEVPDTPFDSVSSGSVAFSDVNGDGSSDVLLTGWNSTVGDGIAKLYLNNGTGQFSEMAGTPFDGVRSSSIAFSDVNGDGSSDVLITGGNNFGNRIAKLYVNDGTGQFFKIEDTPFEGVSNSSIAFSDVNGDGTPDVLLSGDIGTGVPITKLYTNDGTVSFSEMENTPFEGVSGGTVAFSDVNGDGTFDVFILGATHNYYIYANSIAKLYTNDGTGNFTTSYVEGVSSGSIAFSDVNGDGTSDVLITGDKTIWKAPIAILYLNDGDGNFSEVSDTPFEGVSGGTVAFSDVNGDGTPDVLIGSIMYLNDGDGNFSKLPDTLFEVLGGSSAAFSDVNGDGTPDVLLTGRNNLEDGIAKLYINNGDGDFSEKPDTPFEGVSSGSIAFSDVNGDGSPDVLLTGRNNLEDGIAKLYLNNGEGDFSEKPDTPFEGVFYSSIAFSDVNGDGSSDVLLTGRNNLGDEIAKLYLNNGDGNFSEKLGTPFEVVSSGSIAFSDVNGDGSPDLLLTGLGNSGNIAKLYLNNGDGDFSEKPDTPFEGVSNSSIAFSDVNEDGTEDVFITGDKCSFILISKLYLNDGAVNSISKMETKEKPFVRVYPNPNSTGVVIVDYESAHRAEIQLSIYDVTGKMKQQLNTLVSTGLNSIPIDLSTVSKGMFLVKLDDGTHSTTLKLIIQ